MQLLFPFSVVRYVALLFLFQPFFFMFFVHFFSYTKLFDSFDWFWGKNEDSTGQ